jgi:DNA-binding transcriptional MocR family regulator
VAERLLRCMQASAQGASSHAQVLAARLLGAWGDTGLASHVAGLQREYARRAEALMAAAERHLGADANGGGALATWTRPGAGMFLWVRLGCGVEDAQALQAELAAFKVVVVPGKFFHVSGDATPQVRLSFASATDADFDAGMARLASLLRSLPGAPQPEAAPTPDKAQEAPPADAATSSDEQDDSDDGAC